ncbi:tRNA lysidine(34) synthetase TilS [Wenyingzhuangia sp. IMCC45533]
MLKELQNHLSDKFPFLSGQQLLVAVSGGMDSVVLAHLLHTLNYNIAIAHCNFKLRDQDSNLDQNFVRELAEQFEVPFHTIDFDTEKYCQQNKVSTQIGARKLRYQWFKKLADNHQYKYILTAHHLNDVMETFFINLSRGTGIEGLCSIPPINQNIIRPLLIFSRKDIEQYVIQQNITWREDKSNAETKYLRNKVRHRIIPEFYELNPQFESNFKTTIQNIHQSKSFISKKINEIKSNFLKPVVDEIHISKEEMKSLSDFEIYEIFKNYGFTSVVEIRKILKAQTGKELISNHFRLLNNRKYLILYKPQNTSNKYVIKNISDFSNLPVNLIITAEKQVINTNTICIDLDKNPFPFILRKREEGDTFSPLGMMGTKKISKYLKDLKLSKIEKEQIWILCNNQNKIIWIVGLRADKNTTVKDEKENVIYVTKQ